MRGMRVVAAILGISFVLVWPVAQIRFPQLGTRAPLRPLRCKDLAMNFLAATRPQNVGANQHGGMRVPEEIVENYWKDHPDSDVTIWYQSTPIYNNDEIVSRGNVVDVLSSDGTIDTELVIINDAEGWAIDCSTSEILPL